MKVVVRWQRVRIVIRRRPSEHHSSILPGGESTGLRRRTISAISWNGAAQFLVQALQFLTSMAMARLLGPGEFGLMAMVMVFSGFASIFSDMGLGAALIQRKDLSDRHINTAFWINVGMGVFLTSLFLGAAPLVAGFYHQPQLRLVTALVSLTFIPTALTGAQYALLDKSLNFRARFWVEATSAFGAGVIAIGMALKGFGVWSLVGQLIASTVVRLILTWSLSPWRPSWSFDPGAFKELFRFSRNLLANGIFGYWGKNIDRLVLGRFMGSVDLGVYSFAFRAINLPLDLTTSVTNAVMFPAFSMMQDDTAALGRVYLRSTGMVALVTFPILIGLAALAEPVVLLIYGNRWRASVGIVQILAFSALVQSVYNTAPWVFLSQGRSNLLLRLGVYASLVRAAGAAAGVSWGIAGVAWAYVAGSYGFLWYPTWRSAGKLVGLRFNRMVRNLAGPFFSAASMGAVMWIADRWIVGQFAPWLRVATGLTLGILVYVFLIQRLKLEAWTELRTTLLEVGGERLPFLRTILGEQSQVRV
jgi:O-antigen/teichoic acid export membrane protein